MRLAYHQSSFAPLAPVNAVPLRKNAKILTHRRFQLGALCEGYRKVCADLIAAAYPARSPNAQARAAAKATGIPRDTFYRILREETARPDFAAVMAAIRCSSQQVSGCKAFGLLLAILTSEGK